VFRSFLSLRNWEIDLVQPWRQRRDVRWKTLVECFGPLNNRFALIHMSLSHRSRVLIPSSSAGKLHIAEPFHLAWALYIYPYSRTSRWQCHWNPPFINIDSRWYLIRVSLLITSRLYYLQPQLQLSNTNQLRTSWFLKV
jgi:hypothetical protein